MTLTAAPPVTPSPLPARPLAKLFDWIGDNKLFCAVLLAGAVLRLLVAIAYAPALEFFGDSPAYLAGARHLGHISLWHPSGYPFFLWLLSLTHSLLAVTLLQHALGLATGVLIYRLMRSFGLGPVASTIAATPLVLDAYQVDLEQFVLSDALFTFLVILACVLTVRVIRSPSAGAAVALGAVAAAATLTRTIGLALVVSVLITLVATRVPARRVVAAGLTFALPLIGYVFAFHSTYGVYALQGYSGRYMYGLVAPVADCHQPTLYCPTLPKAARPGSNQYDWSVFDFVQPRQKPLQSSQKAGAFAKHIVLHQPVAVGGVVLGDFLHYFSPVRTVGPRDWFLGSWQFPTSDAAPGWNVSPANESFDGKHVHNTINAPLATALRAYQGVMFVPGLALGLAALAAAASLCLRRRLVPRHPILLLTACGLSFLIVPSFSAGFDWRYTLPAQALLIPAGVMAAHDLLAILRERRPRIVTWVVATAALAVTLPSVAVPSVYAASHLRPKGVVATPGTARIGGRLDVTVGQPTVDRVRCRWREGARRLGAYVQFPVSFRHVAGSPMLVQGGNFATREGFILGALPGARHHPDLTSALVGTAYPSVTGKLDAFVTSTDGDLRYVDPLGAGAAAWSYTLPPAPDAHLGSRCSGSSPWAGAQVQGLHVVGMPLFTLAGSQTIRFRLAHDASRARSFDMRLQTIGTDGRAGAWQSQPQWQRMPRGALTLSRLVPGATYCVSVRARDVYGLATAWTPPTCTTRLYDDTALPPTQGWVSKANVAGFYEGSATIAEARGDKVTLAAPFVYRRAAVLLYRCPRCGIVDIYSGASRLARVNLTVSTAMTGLHLWESAPLTGRLLSLRVVANGRDVIIDAFGFSPH